MQEKSKRGEPSGSRWSVVVVVVVAPAVAFLVVAAAVVDVFAVVVPTERFVGGEGIVFAEGEHFEGAGAAGGTTKRRDRRHLAFRQGKAAHFQAGAGRQVGNQPGQRLRSGEVEEKEEEEERGSGGGGKREWRK